MLDLPLGRWMIQVVRIVECDDTIIVDSMETHPVVAVNVYWYTNVFVC
jgi:hypothetical protein